MYFANFLRLISPIPLVAPTKMATRRGGKVDEMRVLEAWIVLRETIVKVHWVIWKHSIKAGLGSWIYASGLGLIPKVW